MNYNKEIAEVFDRVLNLEGVDGYEEYISIRGNYVDDYLLVGFLGRLINENKVDIVIKNNITEVDQNYLERLLHLQKR